MTSTLRVPRMCTLPSALMVTLVLTSSRCTVNLPLPVWSRMPLFILDLASTSSSVCPLREVRLRQLTLPLSPSTGSMLSGSGVGLSFPL